MAQMTTEEAFVKVLQQHCAHECNAGMMSDGYTRASGKMSMCIAQNGPGITNFVTPIKTAYWNHTPLLLVTPQAANKTIGQGGRWLCSRTWFAIRKRFATRHESPKF